MLPHNPLHERALTITDVQPDVSFVVINAGRAVMHGTFKGVSEHTDEGGWSDVPAVLEDEAVAQISPYAIGIVCQPNGKWQTDTFAMSIETEK